MNCNAAVAAFIESLDSGTALSDEQREHLRSCGRCRNLVESAREFQKTLEADPVHEPAVDESRLAAEVQRAHGRTVLKRAAGVLLLLAVPTAVMVALRSRAGLSASGLSEPEAILIPMVLLLVVAVFGLFVSAVRRLGATKGRRLYRRLGPGRQLLGLCIGLEEATGVDRAVFRLLFVILLFASGVGLWGYMIVGLATPVHPADREHLWRFQARRLLQRMRNSP